MKLAPLFQLHRQPRLIGQFGRARLIRFRNGRHELIGGSAADRTAAREWISHFAHEIVLSRPERETEAAPAMEKTFLASRLQPLT